jgi:Fe-S cluster assembly protein SufD
LRALDTTAVDRAASTDAAWRSEDRRTAFALYEKLGMPSSTEEMWRYVDLDFDLADFLLPDAPGTPGDGALPGFPTDAGVVVVDGTALSDPTERDGAWVGPLAAAMGAHEKVLEMAAARGVPADTDKFAAAHRAFGGDGALVHLGRGKVGEPVLVQLHAATSGVVTFPHVVVVADETAQASVVVHMVSAPDVDALVVPHIDVIAAPGANVAVSVIQNFGRKIRSIGHTRSVLDRDASLLLAEAGLGAALSRLHLEVDLEGRGASADIVGAYFGDQQQVLDYRYFMHHAGTNTRSDMFLKGAVEDQALSVFTGMIRIDESAQRTDAFQTNRNLILSEGAAAQSVPNLEILANDVRCGHGSTVGPLDEEQRYYLMSRGLEPQRADRLQVRGFFEEALAKFPHDTAAGPVREWINAKFVEAQEEGRL